MFLSLRMHARHWSNPLGRCFFHCGCMPGTGAVRWGDISFRTSPRRPIEPPILTRRTRDQQTGGTGVMGTEGHGRGAGGRQHGQNKHTHLKPHPIGAHRVACGARPRCRRAAAGPGQTTSQRTEQHQRPGSTGVEGAGGTGGHGRGAGGRQHGQNKHTHLKPHPIGAHRVACGARPRCRRAAAGPGQTTSQRTEQHQRPGTTGVEGAGGTGGHGRGAGGRRQGQGGPRDRPLRAAGSRVAISRAGRRPPAHTAARPFKAGLRRPEIRRRPEHQRHSTSPATGKGKPTAPGTP